MRDEAGGHRWRFPSVFGVWRVGPGGDGGSRRTRCYCPNRDGGDYGGSRHQVDPHSYRIPSVLEERSRAGLGHRPRVGLMFSPNSGPDPAGRAALGMLMQRLPELSLIDGGYLEPFNSSEPPTLRSAPVVEGSGMRAIRVPDYSRQSTSNFGAFLDGAQRVQVVGHRRGIPIVYATVSAAIRVRINRRFVTWGHRPPLVTRSFFLPFRYLPELGQSAPIAGAEAVRIVDTSKADINGEFPSAHPSVLQERAVRAVDELREQLEFALAEDRKSTRLNSSHV